MAAQSEKSDMSTPEHAENTTALPDRVLRRRPHPKSRSGCKTCKRRKVKCDETRPSCNNCERYSVRCDFLARTPPTSLSRGVLNIPDLELMHNYTSSTYATLSWDPLLRYFWKETAVKFGFECDFVMRAILAVSALHLARHRPDRRDYYIDIALDYHKTAAREAIDLMSAGEPSTENARELFIFSSLTVYFALGSPRGDLGGTLLVGETSFPTWMSLIRGSKSILQYTEGDWREGPLKPLFAESQSRFLLTHRELLQGDKIEWPKTKDQDMLTALEQLIRVNVADPDDKEVYLHAIRELRAMYKVFYDLSIRMDIIDAMVWVAQVIDGFPDRLTVQAQEAVAIFAHYSVLLKRQETSFWLEGWADHLLTRAYGMLDSVHRMWISAAIEDIGWIPPA